jgi:hypothetical protein
MYARQGIISWYIARIGNEFFFSKMVKWTEGMIYLSVCFIYLFKLQMSIHPEAVILQ